MVRNNLHHLYLKGKKHVQPKRTINSCSNFFFFEQKALASLQAIQHLKMTTGLPVLGQYLQAFNMNPNVQWITDIQTTSVGGDFKVTFNKLRDTSTPNSYTTDFDSYTEAKTLSRVGLLELDSGELVSLQIATLVESGVNGKVLCVWRLDDDHVLVSLKAIGTAVFSLGILKCLDDTVEIIDLRPEARAAKIQVQPTTTEETDLSMNDIRAKAEEQVNTQP